MRKKLPFAVLAFCCFAAHAEFDEISPSKPSDPTTSAYAPPALSTVRTHQLAVGLNLYGFDYRETLPPPLRSEERGFLPAIQARYETKAPGEGWYFAGILDASFLQTNYYGTLQPSGTPIAYAHASTILQLEGDVGVRFVSSASMKLDGYLGLGYRYWSRGRPSDGPGTYNEEYQWMYLPVGVRATYDFSQSFEAGLDASLRFPFGGRIKFFLSGTGPFTDAESTLGGNIVGFKLMAPIRLKTLLPFTIVATPWFEYSAIGDGPLAAFFATGAPNASLIKEPASRTYQYGVVLQGEFGL